MVQFEHYIDLFLSLPVYIRFAIAGILLASTGLVCLYGIIAYFRISNRNIFVKQSSVSQLISRITANLIAANNRSERLYLNQAFDLAIYKLAELLKGNPKNRAELVAHLIRLRKLFDGETGLLLRKVYLSLRLQNYAKKDLEKGNRNGIKKALYELYQMDVRIDFSVISPLLKNKDQWVRRFARCYCIKFDKAFPLDCLNEDMEGMHRWEQFELFSILSKRKEPYIPLFSCWLNEKAHPSVISFYLKLIVHFKQKDAIPEMKELLSSGNIQIVKETIHALGELKDVHIEDFFIANYKYQPVECKIEILKALGKVNSKRHLNFLIQEFNETDILDIKKHAAKSLINKNPDSGKLLAFLYGDSKGLNNTVLHHVLNPLIKN